MPCHAMQCILYNIYFWKGFSYVLQIDMHLICPPMLTEFYSCKKWVLQVVTGIPRYPGYKTLTVVPEPFVEQVVGVIRSTGGRVGTHMLLRVPSQDRVTTMGCHGTT
jgi:hypothetical protein